MLTTVGIQPSYINSPTSTPITKSQGCLLSKPINHHRESHLGYPQCTLHIPTFRTGYQNRNREMIAIICTFLQQKLIATVEPYVSYFSKPDQRDSQVDRRLHIPLVQGGWQTEENPMPQNAIPSNSTPLSTVSLLSSSPSCLRIKAATIILHKEWWIPKRVRRGSSRHLIYSGTRSKQIP